MLKPLIFLCLLAVQLNALSQNDWVTKDLGSGISVKFPSDPVYKLTDKTGGYTSKTTKNLFIALVQYDALPHYTEFLKLPDEQKERLINIFLDNTVKGIVMVDGVDNVPSIALKLGNFPGRQFECDGINPVTGNSTKKFYKLFLVFNKAYVFQCMCSATANDCIKEKNNYLNSITSN